MTALLFLGGPCHGQHLNVEDGRDTVYAPMVDRRLRATHDRHTTERNRLIEQGADPDDLILPLWPAPRIVTYHRSRVQIVGWRFPLVVMTNWPAGAAVPDGCIMPGYVHGVPAEHEPVRNPPPLHCTCHPYADLLQYLRPNLSSCYLDHCPTHGPFRPKDTP